MLLPTKNNKPMKYPFLFASAISLISMPSLAESDPVSMFIQGFNEQKIELMLAQTTEDVTWFNVSITKVDLQASGHSELGAAMTDYFQTLPGAKASILGSLSSGNYVSTLEKVSWQQDGEQNSQCNMGVYTLRGDKIAAVWYYPAQECDTPEAEIGLPRGDQPWQQN